MNSKLNFALLTTVFLAVASSRAAEKDIIEKSFTAKPGGRLQMNVDRGSIHITTSASDKVEVTVVRELKRASDSRAREVYDLHKIDINQAGDTVKIEADNPQKFRLLAKNPFNNLQVDYTIAIPSKFNLDLHTSGGNIDVDDLQGEVKADTSGGNLKFGAITGEINAHTSGGNITLESVRGSTKVETSGGNIRVNEAFGPVVAMTSGGNVSARFADQPKSNCTLKTSGGNIAVALADKISVDIDAHTSGGRISSDFPGDLNKERTKLVAQVNGGGPDLVLETSGGNVEIKRK